MRYVYPCVLTPEEGGGFFAAFPDVPEALTGGETEAETLALAADALAVALAAYGRAQREIPVPGEAAPGAWLVPVPPVVAAKLALYAALRREGITPEGLAVRLGVSAAAARKLADPSQRSPIDRVEAALRRLGRALVIEDAAA